LTIGADSVLSEIVEEGTLHVFRPEADNIAFEQLLIDLLVDTKVLHTCWQRFAFYDYNASLARIRFEWLEWRRTRFWRSASRAPCWPSLRRSGHLR
jgi:hypothetical protein